MTTDNIIKNIGNSPYILLPDGSVARKLKPTMLNNVPHWNLCVGDRKTMRVRTERLDTYVAAFDAHAQAHPGEPQASE